jgi:hypothetical protein
MLRRGKERVLVIPDLQIPYEHPDAFDFINAVSAEIEPTVVVNVGDEVDQHYVGRFDTDPEADGGGVELRKSVERLQQWYKQYPKCLVCMSNHTQRVYKKAFHAGIPEAYLKPVREWLESPPGWVWDDIHVRDGIVYEHGDAQGGVYAVRNLAIRRRQSVVIGHHHAHAGVFYINNGESTIFGMNVGCLIDDNSLAFKYGKNSAFKPTLGCGVVLYGVPFFIPMLTDKHNHWTRELIL